jgi:hypothetical protein
MAGLCADFSQCLEQHMDQNKRICLRCDTFPRSTSTKLGFSIKKMNNYFQPLNDQPFVRRWGRAARWHIFQTKIPIWVNFGGTSKDRCGYILWSLGLFLRTFGTFCGHLVKFYGHLPYFTLFWYIVPRKLWQSCDGGEAAEYGKCEKFENYDLFRWQGSKFGIGF